MRRLLIATTAFLLAACSAAPRAAPTATPTHATEASVTPTPRLLAGIVGKALEVPGVGTVTVASASEWSGAGLVGQGGYRWLAVKLQVEASLGSADLSPTTFVVLDQSGVSYTAKEGGAAPALKLPMSLPDGKRVEGSLTYQVPLGGIYTFRVVGTETASVPLSVIVALATPTPRPATPRPATPTQGTSGGGGSGGGPSGGSGWTAAAYQTAIAWENSVSQAYVVTVPSNATDLAYFSCCAPGTTTEERNAAAQEALVYLNAAKGAVSTHLTWMTSHPAATCFKDAYAADRTMAKAWLSWLNSWQLAGGENTPEGRAQIQTYNAVSAQNSAFIAAISGYFNDCR